MRVKLTVLAGAGLSSPKKVKHVSSDSFLGQQNCNRPLCCSFIISLIKSRFDRRLCFTPLCDCCGHFSHFSVVRFLVSGTPCFPQCCGRKMRALKKKNSLTSGSEFYVLMVPTDYVSENCQVHVADSAALGGKNVIDLYIFI